MQNQILNGYYQYLLLFCLYNVTSNPKYTQVSVYSGTSHVTAGDQTYELKAGQRITIYADGKAEGT